MGVDALSARERANQSTVVNVSPTVPPYIDDCRCELREPPQEPRRGGNNIMSRVQLALNVTDLPAAIAFYGALFDTEPAKVRDGYANFAIADPPLKLVLIEGGTGAEGGTINHLGVEVPTTDEVATASRRLAATGLATDDRSSETCCYATQDKVWVSGPDLERWEVYTVLSDADQMSPVETSAAAPVPAGVACCS
jgi:catechol 2,3-dioxygenase-like lactoylglutathione lyase family enzyme